MAPVERAVKSMTELGLTEYEARCFVALTRLPKGTAKEISQVADIPRSRVYDTVDRLERKGLVETQQSDPREYKAMSVETACRRLEEDYTSRIEAAGKSLQQVEEPESADNEGMWAISRSDHVTDRIVAFLDDATETVHLLVATDDVVDQRILDHLESASERGVDVYVEVPTADVRDRIQNRLPDTTVVLEPTLETTDLVDTELPAQLLMVDKQSIVAAGLKEGDLPDVFHETAVWTYGHDHGFAAWIRELLEDRFTDRDEDQ